MEHSKLVQQHFDTKYKEYDALIRRLIPRYGILHDTVVRNVKIFVDQPKILDLGIGTGQTAVALLSKYKDATIMGIDISKSMIRQAKSRLKNNLKRASFLKADMATVVLKEPYDACVAVLSIHHLTGSQKERLFKKVYDSLNPNAPFVIGDIIVFPTKKGTLRKENQWRQHLFKVLGRDQGEFWFQNYLEEDRPSSVDKQLYWLKRAGFREVKCVWRHINYAVLTAKK